MEEVLKRNLDRVRERIGEAAARAGRSADDVSIIVVTKYASADVIAALAKIGVRDIGENYVQDALAKREALGDAAKGLKWHMIGHLQRNKAKKALTLFHTLHSLDSERLMLHLCRLLERNGGCLPVFIEVKTSEEGSKFGADEDETFRMAEFLLTRKEFRFMGLMTMAPFFEDAESARPYFVRLRELRERLRDSFGKSVAPYLSMGMSSDFEVAVQEGATHLRIGSAIVGDLGGG